MIPAAITQAAANRLRVEPSEPRWRFCSQFNRAASQISFTGSASFQTALAARQIHRIGSGDVSVAKILIPNWSMGNANIQATGNAIEVTAAYLENTETGQTVPITFNGGAPGLTIPDLTTAESDPIPPVAFGLQSMALDSRWATRVFFRLPLSGIMPMSTRNDSDETKCWYYDSTSVSCTNPGGAGLLTFTGHTGFTFVPSVVMVGKFTAGDPRVWLGVGDSILEGAGDVPFGDSGASFFGRALRINKQAGMNLGKPSGNTEAWVGGGYFPRLVLFDLVKYCNGAVCENGTNRFDTNANGSASSRQSTYVVEWGLMHFLRNFSDARPGVSPFKIMRTLLMCRGAAGSTDTNQTLMGPMWDAGGDVELWNTQMSNDVGVFNRADAVFDPGLIVRRSQSGKGVAGSDYYKWVTDTSGDWTHPNVNGHTLIGNGFAPALAAVG